MLARIRARAENNRELKFLKMVPNNVSSHGITLDPKSGIDHNPILSAVSKIHAARVQLRRDYELEYLSEIERTKKMVENVRGPAFREKMWIERYEWWIEQKEKLGVEHENFDEFYALKNPPPVQESPSAQDAQIADSKKKGQTKTEKDSKKGGKKDGKKGKKSERDSGSVEDSIPYSVLIGPTPIIGDLYRSVKKYTEFWAKLDESKNFRQCADSEITAEKVTPEIVEKIRASVDTELMAVLDNLKLQVQLRLQEENAKNGKKGKKGAKSKGGKPKSSKKGGKGKKEEVAGKPKKCCDGEKALGDVSLAQCIDELTRLGIAQKLPDRTKSLQNFVGDYSCLGAEYESAGIIPDPSFAQIRSIVTESLIIPLGSPYVKKNAPVCNAVLFYGPVGSGKTMLSKAVAWHTNSFWLDLSPQILDKKLGPSKQEVGRLVHMVFRVAKEASPTVIYVDQMEKMFALVSKKKSASNSVKSDSPGTEEMLKIKKEFMAHRDGLTESDRVLIIGNSSNPFGDSVDQSEIKSFFKSKGKMIFTPFPDYATRLCLWKTFILNAGVNVYALRQINSKFDLGTLVYVSHGYSAGSIQAAVQAVLPNRRVAKLNDKCKLTISVDEFIAALSRMPYTYKDQQVSFKDFTEDITGVKQRKALQAAGIS